MDGRLVRVLLASTLSVACSRKSVPTPVAAPSASSRIDATPTAGASGGATPPESATEVIFTRRLPPVGTKSIEDRSADLSLTIRGARETRIYRGEVEKRSEEVVGTSAIAVTSVKVKWLAKRSTEQTDGRGTGEESVLQGKTYVVTAHDGRIDVKTEAGADAPPRDATEARADYASLGKPDPLFAAIPEKPLRVGERVPTLEAALGEVAGAGVVDATVRLASIDRAAGSATFDVDLRAREDAGGAILDETLSGTLKVRVDGAWPLELSLKGPVRALPNVAAGADPKSGGSGARTLRIAATFDQEKKPQ